eukprot:CAMPEP_0116870866 /NCGR_PEP_ID=MMETSP0463-20121206/969_1 /TAXON_ID=181622 /ORGANISM="Strombidinopsis sp, Strain SopsisLIS2011" /LENGTH=75 /DNA_ID=CAMNT_0004508221 /DNA_START=1798 /DNA_END=2022 /DNA_ORIENTATION=+
MKAYIVGIIDPLTEFNFAKYIEYGAKKLRHGNQMSCVPPTMYARRFYRFMEQIFVLDPEERSRSETEGNQREQNP